MADIDTLPPPPSNQVDRDLAESVPPVRGEEVHLSGEIKEEGIFASLIANVRDAFFSPKLPPLVLESKPVAVPDRMATKRSPTSTAVAIGAHVVVILLVALFIANQVKVLSPPKPEIATVTVPPTPPPVAPKLEQIGGGGGQHDIAQVSKGRLPDLAQKQLIPPKAPPTQAPRLAVIPTVVVQKNLNLANNNMPNLGMPSSSLKGISLGNGTGTGIGSGNGSGIGPGSGGNIGGGAMHIGGGVSRPEVLYQVEPEFSEEARKAKFSGNVEVYLWVDADGKPSHIRVVRGVGMGLDEKAVEAVRQYRFKPAMKNGKPVTVDLYVDVNFQIL
ncbi:MAG: energy transducer TonB [Acidobacteriaceae bacterium]